MMRKLIRILSVQLNPFYPPIATDFLTPTILSSTLSLIVPL